MQNQVTTTHEILRDRKAIVPLPQYAQFIEDSALVIACVGGGVGKGRLVNDTVKEEHAFLAYETVCVYNKGHEVGTSGESAMCHICHAWSARACAQRGQRSERH